jgi:hypothetical protein
MNRFIPALFAALVMTGGAYAQSINIGPGGVGIDTRSPRERAVERDIRREERARERDRYERRRDRRAERRGRDCRTIITREETPRGVIRRETRVCD